MLKYDSRYWRSATGSFARGSVRESTTREGRKMTETIECACGATRFETIKEGDTKLRVKCMACGKLVAVISESAKIKE